MSAITPYHEEAFTLRAEVGVDEELIPVYRLDAHFRSVVERHEGEELLVSGNRLDGCWYLDIR
jgi:hypothetical protein